MPLNSAHLPALSFSSSSRFEAFSFSVSIGIQIRNFFFSNFISQIWFLS